MRNQLTGFTMSCGILWCSLAISLLGYFYAIYDTVCLHDSDNPWDSDYCNA